MVNLMMNSHTKGLGHDHQFSNNGELKVVFCLEVGPGYRSKKACWAASDYVGDFCLHEALKSVGHDRLPGMKMHSLMMIIGNKLK